MSVPDGQPDNSERAPWYPAQEKHPQQRCPSCGRFLKWNDWDGSYVRHLVLDSYVGGYEATCQ